MYIAWDVYMHTMILKNEIKTTKKLLLIFQFMLLLGMFWNHIPSNLLIGKVLILYMQCSVPDTVLVLVSVQVVLVLPVVLELALHST